MTKSVVNKNVLLYLLLILFFSVLFALNLSISDEQQFIYLSKSFLQGKLYILEEFGILRDTTFYNGHYYYPLGPFPAVILLPFVAVFDAVGFSFYQGFLQPILVLVIGCLAYKIAKHFLYSTTDSLILSFGFVFSSVFLSVGSIPISGWYAQVVCVLLIFLFIYEYVTRKRYLILGILAGFLLLTRLSLLPLSLLVVGELLVQGKGITVTNLKKITIYSLPILVSILILFFYNFARFNSFTEQGYSSQTVVVPALQELRSIGLFNIEHLPRNMYYFMLSVPLLVKEEGNLVFPFVRSDPWGTSILITSPWIMYMLFIRYKDTLSKLIATTIILIATPIFLYYGIGYVQLGYRYSLDFLPLMYWLLIMNYKKTHKSLSFPFKLLLIAPAFSNLYLLFSYYFQ